MAVIATSFGTAACGADMCTGTVLVLAQQNAPSGVRTNDGLNWITLTPNRANTVKGCGPQLLELQSAGEWGVTIETRPGAILVILPPLWQVGAGYFAGGSAQTRDLVEFVSMAPSLIPSELHVWPEFPVRVAIVTDGEGRPEHEPLYEQVADAITVVNNSAGLELLRLWNSADPKDAGVTVMMQGLGGSLGTTLRIRNSCGPPGLRGGLCAPRWTEEVRVLVAADAPLHILVHELLHVLGVGHTCIVGSVMATEFGPMDLQQCGSARAKNGYLEPLYLSRTTSVADAAALEILYHVAVALRGRYGYALVWAILPD